MFLVDGKIKFVLLYVYFYGVCVLVWVCVKYICECGYTRAKHVYAGQRTTSGVSPQLSSTFCLRQSLSLAWNVAK